MPPSVARGRIFRGRPGRYGHRGERMNRQLVIATWTVALVAVVSLVIDAQTPQFTPLTDEMLRSPAAADWPAWRRDRAGTGYSPLDQINRSNVRRLHLAWASTLEAGSLEPEPLVFNGVMYVPHPGDIVQADRKSVV